MKKANIKPLVLSALSALAFGAVGTAGTFALFTDKAETTVQVQAGIVDVDATISDLAFYELDVTTPITETDTNGALINSIGGTAKIDGSTLVLNKWAPGDKVTFKLTTKNKSNVKIRTKLRETHSTTSTVDLYEALNISYARESGIAEDKIFHWSPVEAAVNAEGDIISVVNVTIEFPNHGDLITAREEGLDNHFQDSNCTIVFSQQAVQGNAEAVDLVSQWNAVLAGDGVNDSLTAAIAEVDGTEAQLKSERIVWKAAEDKFYYEEEVAGADRYQYFKAYDAMPTIQSWSIYASSSWTSGNDIALKGVGFDAGGKAASIETVSYVGEATERTNRIYTNSTSTDITINAPQDTVKHYGVAGTLDIQAVAGSSYHEFGKVAFVEISKGRIALESTSKVAQIHVEKKTESTFDEIIIAKAPSVELPTLSRDDVNIPSGGTLVVALQEGTAEITTETDLDYVWLTKQGIYEQIAVSDNKVSAVSAQQSQPTYADQAESTNTQNAAQQIANNIGRDSEGKVNEAVTVGTTEATIILDENRDLIVVTDVENPSETKMTGEAVEVAIEQKVVEKGLDQEAKKAAAEEQVAIVTVEGDGSYVARIDGNGYTSISAAFEAAASKTNPTIIMLCDAEVDDEISVDSKMTLDLCGKTLASEEYSFWFENNTDITIKNGKLVTPEECSLFGDLSNDDVTLVFDGVTIEAPNAAAGWNLFDFLGENINITFNNSNLIYRGHSNVQLIRMVMANDCRVEFKNTPFEWGYRDFVTIASGCETSPIVFDNASIAEKDYWRVAPDADDVGITRTIANGKVTFQGREVEQWTSVVTEAPETYVVASNGDIEIGSAEAFAWFAKQAASTDFSGKTVRLTADISMHNHEWTAITCANNGHFAGTFDGQGHYIDNVRAVGVNYGNGIFYSIIGSVVNLKVRYARIGDDLDGNMVGIVAGYAYGTVNFTNIHVTDSDVNGFGKVGGILGMAADPGTSVTSFVNCSVENVQIHGDYNVAGIMGNCQNVASMSQTRVRNIEWIHDSYYDYEIVVNGHSTCEENDIPTCLGESTFSGIYWVYDNYLWGGFADLYVHYGDGKHDCKTDVLDKDGNPYGGIANSERTVDAPYTDADGWKWSEAPTPTPSQEI